MLTRPPIPTPIFCPARRRPCERPFCADYNPGKNRCNFAWYAEYLDEQATRHAAGYRARHRPVAKFTFK